MNKAVGIIVGVVLVLVVVGGWFIANKQSETKKMGQEPTATVNDESSAPADTNSRYVEYANDILSQTANTRRVLFFYANWCPICLPADSNFKENADKIPLDVTLIRVNYNDTDTDKEEKDLANQYGVTYQHTFVQIDSAGQAVTKWNGGQLDELLANIK